MRILFGINTSLQEGGECIRFRYMTRPWWLHYEGVIYDTLDPEAAPGERFEKGLMKRFPCLIIDMLGCILAG